MPDVALFLAFFLACYLVPLVALSYLSRRRRSDQGMRQKDS